MVAISNVESGFVGARGVTKVVIPNSVKSIKSSFYDCTSLEEVVFPNIVEELNTAGLFKGCEKLKTVTLPQNINVWESNMFEGCWGLQAMDIPHNVTSLKNGVFNNCINLESVRIPNAVEEIERSVFCLCQSLMNIHSEIEVPYDIPESAFDEYTYKNATLHVPQGTKSKYKQCKGWKNFLKIHEEGEYDMTQLIVTVNASGNGKVLFRDTEIRDGSKEFDVLTFFGRDLMFDIIPDEGYHIKNVTRNDVDVTDKLEVEDDVIRYIQYDALKGMTLSVVFEKDTESDVFTVKNSEGVDITYSILNREAKTCQVGTGQRGATAINTSVSGIVTIPTIVNGYYVVKNLLICPLYKKYPN